MASERFGPFSRQHAGYCARAVVLRHNHEAITMRQQPAPADDLRSISSKASLDDLMSGGAACFSCRSLLCCVYSLPFLCVIAPPPPVPAARYSCRAKPTAHGRLRVAGLQQARELVALKVTCLAFGCQVEAFAAFQVAAHQQQKPVREMPPFFAKLLPSKQLGIMERRGCPLTPNNVHTVHGGWVRVKAAQELVKSICEPQQPAPQQMHDDEGGAADEEEDPAYQPPAVQPSRPAWVGWNAKMNSTLGRVFQVQGPVDERSWSCPVAGLAIPDGWACVSPPFGTAHDCKGPCVGGWFYPLQALEPI